jgi:hypothetical protein
MAQEMNLGVTLKAEDIDPQVWFVRDFVENCPLREERPYIHNGTRLIVLRDDVLEMLAAALYKTLHNRKLL